MHYLKKWTRHISRHINKPASYIYFSSKSVNLNKKTFCKSVNLTATQKYWKILGPTKKGLEKFYWLVIWSDLLSGENQNYFLVLLHIIYKYSLANISFLPRPKTNIFWKSVTNDHYQQEKKILANQSPFAKDEYSCKPITIFLLTTKKSK